MVAKSPNRWSPPRRMPSGNIGGPSGELSGTWLTASGADRTAAPRASKKVRFMDGPRTRMVVAGLVAPRIAERFKLLKANPQKRGTQAPGEREFTKHRVYIERSEPPNAQRKPREEPDI